MSIKDVLHAVEGERLDLCSQSELMEAIEVADAAYRMDKAHLETLRACHFDGPLWDGDVPSKSHRSDLARVGAISKISVRGEQGFNACTYYGYSLLKALEFLYGNTANE